jgi:Na+-driven multidrug efflux pump
MLPMALGSAVNTWVSNSLGAGLPLAARSVFRSGMVLVVGLQAVIAFSLVTGGQHIAQVGAGRAAAWPRLRGGAAAPAQPGPPAQQRGAP